jgi:hypothetical protein
MQRGRINPEDRELLVHKYLWTGSLTKVGKMFGVTPAAIHKAKKTAWWQPIEDQLLTELRQEHGARLRRNLTQSLDALEDRIQNGDEVAVTPKGEEGGRPELMRVKMRGRDLALTFGILSTHMTKSQPNQQVTINMDLASLAAQFSALAQSQNQSTPLDGSLVQLPGGGKSKTE